jgi:hypothetical protein
MKIEQLTEMHVDMIRDLFNSPKYMGTDIKEHTGDRYTLDEYNPALHRIFSETYLSRLNNFKAFGSIEDEKVTSIISFYESIDNAEWYWTQIRSNNMNAVPVVLDEVIKYNENNGRLKFYSLFNKKYVRSVREFSFSNYNKERYDYFDEFYVPAKQKCVYSMPWQVLFNRSLISEDMVLRCSFLKQKYRVELISGGNI